ncbi:hypothetical protein SSS_06265 [Sarcoptes scabiei]|uniref:Uncharacterized protein n=1 Tax=Sarcoptes scabiei TaxID=52283 RepID=A0A131ZW03_SARSC|nr:hypothetical protein SSS_06265 [Sarcoptes scabiei]KPM03002.1 hypothetical protein QR98_0014300 [Sarcoptes scabiei]
MSRNQRTSTRIARRQTKTSEKAASSQENGQGFDEIDLLLGNYHPKFYPIYTPPNKKVNTHNLAEIPSLQSDEDSVIGQDNASQNSESNERNISPRKQYGNSLIESRSKFRQLLMQMQTKTKPNVNNGSKSDSNFDGYDLKTRRIKFEPHKKTKKDQDHPSSFPKTSSHEYCFKLFEKTIDLSSYYKQNQSHYFSLYPVCRIWSRHKYGLPESFKCKRNPMPPPLLECPDPDGPYSDKPVDVYHLPKPIPLPLRENGETINLRIPKRARLLASSKRTIKDLSFINSLTNLTAKELLDLNMPQWKQQRQEYIDALKENEKRYHHSFAVLQSIFEKANDSEYGSKMAFYKYPPYESDNNESHPMRSKELPKYEESETKNKLPQATETDMIDIESDHGGVTLDWDSESKPMDLDNTETDPRECFKEISIIAEQDFKSIAKNKSRASGPETRFKQFDEKKTVTEDLVQDHEIIIEDDPGAYHQSILPELITID